MKKKKNNISYPVNTLKTRVGQNSTLKRMFRICMYIYIYIYICISLHEYILSMCEGISGGKTSVDLRMRKERFYMNH